MNAVRSILTVFLLSLISWIRPAYAQEAPLHEVVPAEHAEGKKKLDVAGELFGHVGDAHELHLFSFGENPTVLHLPVLVYNRTQGKFDVFSSQRFGELHKGLIDGKEGEVSEEYSGYRLQRGITEKLVSVNGDQLLDFSITKNVLCLLISVVILLLVMMAVGRKAKANGPGKAPTGMQNALEPIVTFFRDEVAKPNLGHKYARFMPLLLTIFFFIWINNLLGLLPFGFNFTGNIAATLCLATISFIVMVVNANKHFWGHLLNPPGVPIFVKVILVPIEIISLFIKPVALTIRLFANILAGHIVILSVVFMIFIFGSIKAAAGIGFAPVSLAFAIFMFFLELLVAAIQAFIFTNLTAVFLGQAIEEAHHHEDASAHHGDEVNEVTGQGYHVSRNEIIA